MFSSFHQYRRLLRRVPLEAFIWTVGLAAMAWTDPAAEGFIDGCLFKWLGVTWCPGCGLGHAVAYLFRGEVAQSLAAHPLGVVTVVVLVGHIGRLVRGRPPAGSRYLERSKPFQSNAFGERRTEGGGRFFASHPSPSAPRPSPFSIQQRIPPTICRK
jgi:hypothetical protein